MPPEPPAVLGVHNTAPQPPRVYRAHQNAANFDSMQVINNSTHHPDEYNGQCPRLELHHNPDVSVRITVRFVRDDPANLRLVVYNSEYDGADIACSFDMV